ncbi:MAG: hypothetical protein U1C49_02085 [Candidatus Andersenbacteria bacterium]|nr:hypothetical protein [bacterium]MDZ4225616.1 hypothetical protein [Candidatus Andersenbacteria bacterium]
MKDLIERKTERQSGGELRQDLITGKWVIVAIGRSKRPHGKKAGGKKKKGDDDVRYRDDCPFCNLADNPQPPDVIRLPDDPHSWRVHVFANKYPALHPQEDFRSRQEGPYRAVEAVGWHELLVTRYHNAVERLVSEADLALEIEALVLRYRQLQIKSSVNYIQIIRNYGVPAGASLAHPHHQIFATPVLPSDVQDMLLGAQRYHERTGGDIFEDMLLYERREGRRVVWENDMFTVFCPFAPRVAYETWIMPKEPGSNFANINPGQREALARALQETLKRMYSVLGDPPLNYFIYSAPCGATGSVCNPDYFDRWRWHLQVTPRLNIWGGFELGTGLEILDVAPEDAAEHLRDCENC